MDDDQQDSALLSVQEAADVLCVSAPTVHGWIADGTLPVQRIDGRSLRIRVKDVQKLRRSKIWLTPNSVTILATG